MTQPSFPGGIGGADTIVVIPCYNESRRLDAAAIETFALAHPRIRFLLVNDGSTDDTAALLARIAGNIPASVSWRSLERNSGKAEAVRQGVLAAAAENPLYVAYWDADFATPLETIPDFLALLDRNASLLGVLGSRVQRLGATIERHALRHYAGRLFATIASFVLKMPIYDTQCGAKMFRVEPVLVKAFDEPFLSPWSFDVEVLARLRMLSAPEEVSSRLYELPLAHWRDVAGSKLTASHGIAAFFDLVRIWLRYR
jgi:glycosyltransferase involved in cell wall biosynthesis